MNTDSPAISLDLEGTKAASASRRAERAHAEARNQALEELEWIAQQLHHAAFDLAKTGIWRHRSRQELLAAARQGRLEGCRDPQVAALVALQREVRAVLTFMRDGADLAATGSD